MSDKTPARQVGPVTTATSAAAAAVMVVCWALSAIWGIEVPTEVQGAAAVVLVALAGWIVKPRAGAGAHAADE